MNSIRYIRSKIQGKTVIKIIQNFIHKFLLGSSKLLANIDETVPFLIGSSVLSSADRYLIKKNLSLKDCHKSQRCFVIGSGSSLNTQDITPLRNEITFGMNSFWRHPVVDEWQPTYYCIADPIFFDGSEVMLDFHKSLEEKITLSKFFIPLSSRKLMEEQYVLMNYKKYYVAFGGLLSSGKSPTVDLCSIVPGVQSVSQLCILIALYMGCSPIYLLGLDHDWLSHRGIDRHFYKGETGFEKHPDVHTDLGKRMYRPELESNLNLWKGYEALANLASKRGIEIYNSTNGGFLDVFERRKFEEAIPNDTLAG
ncbi:MAG: hypothetical protein ACXWC7_20585 [Chitinophagaceae bacterium]